MSRKFKLAIAVVTIALVGTLIVVGTALAEPPTPNNATPPTKEEIKTWMQGMMEGVHGPGSFEEMTQWMDQMHGPGSFDKMAEAMAEGNHCGATGQDGQTGGMMGGGSGGMMGGGSGGMMGGFNRSTQ